MKTTSKTDDKERIYLRVYEPENGLPWCVEILPGMQNWKDFAQTWQFDGKALTVFVYTNDTYARDELLEICRRVIENDRIKTICINLAN